MLGLLLYSIVGILCAPLGSIEHLQIKECKHGQFLLSSRDSYVSKHLINYGEWAEKELQLFLQIVKAGDIVLDVGANIGAFTVPLAKAIGKTGRLYAFEPQRIIFQRLNANIAINDLTNVRTHLTAVGSEISTIPVPVIDYSIETNFAAISLANRSLFINILHENVPVTTLDSMDFKTAYSIHDCPSFIKIDVELMESEVLIGGRNLIQRCKPLLYIENSCIMTSRPLIELLYDMNYIPYWDIQFAYNREVFEGIIEDTNPGHYAINMFCIPKSRMYDTEWNDNQGHDYSVNYNIENNYSSTSNNSNNNSNRKESMKKGGIKMIGYELIERDKPYLHMYFNGQYIQGGNETTCDDGSMWYE